ncbi:type II toxin-antitoxin system RelE/ParE family toxin [Thiomicrospira sp. ALE5]|uniref:type II toxin-antitoxin system RelE/ParE family toxin n=1 Tax=Thiomicrospira sp. ALE5 TaxID=748650 RepID=UPI0008E965A7|nr:type II toxin-antitoxin system RelE/ParE family toxin [Thiomicrospira sp. ALE5]SFR49138.1 Plasmid stabilization system protein ParE [Thiomicrospira sp. ALE5]
MKQIRYTPKARESIKQIAHYLIGQTKSKAFVKKHLDDFRASLCQLLTTFPEAGVQIQIEEISCRRVVVSGYSVLYLLEPEYAIILLVYKQNEPKLKA